MTRKQEREQAFLIIFEISFHNESLEDIIESARLSRDFEDSEFAIKLVKGVFDHIDVLDVRISEHIRGWKIDRISKVSLAALRLAVFEMLYLEDIPVSVSINEAVEITKKYGSEEDASYINGVLGAIAKQCAPQWKDGK